MLSNPPSVGVLVRVEGHVQRPQRAFAGLRHLHLSHRNMQAVIRGPQEAVGGDSPWGYRTMGWEGLEAAQPRKGSDGESVQQPVCPPHLYSTALLCIAGLLQLNGDGISAGPFRIAAATRGINSWVVCGLLSSTFTAQFPVLAAERPMVSSLQVTFECLLTVSRVLASFGLICLTSTPTTPTSRRA